MRFLLLYGGIAMFGVAVGQHLGAFDGIAAALALYVLMPYEPTRRL